jgi:hypothetical protein
MVFRMETNGKDLTGGPPAYIDAFVVTRVLCVGCNQMMSPQNPPLVQDESTIPAAAAEIHRQSGTICHSPRFIIDFTERLIDARLLPRAADTLTPEGEQERPENNRH